MVVNGTRNIPLRVVIIVILSILAGLTFIFPVLDVFGLVHLIDMTGLTFQEGPLVLTTFVIAIANFVIGIGCLYGWRPIWFYLILISIINFVFAMIAILNASGWGTLLIGIFWLALSVLVLFTLQTRTTKEWFFD